MNILTRKRSSTERRSPFLYWFLPTLSRRRKLFLQRSLRSQREGVHRYGIHSAIYLSWSRGSRSSRSCQKWTQIFPKLRKWASVDRMQHTRIVLTDSISYQSLYSTFNFHANKVTVYSVTFYNRDLRVTIYSYCIYLKYHYKLNFLKCYYSFNILLLIS